MKAFLLTFDVEEFDLPRERGRAVRPATQIAATARGLRRILPLLARHRVRATFFVTGEFARRCGRGVEAIAAGGHEAAVHGLVHADDYSAMDPAAAVARLSSAREIVAEACGQPVQGVRTPRLRPCPARVLRAAGFTYDASPHPTWVPGRYNGLRLPRRPWSEAGLVRVPISVMPMVRYPVSWLWYRLAGPRLGGLAARVAAAGVPYLHLYFHPWEATDIRPFGVPRALAIGTGSAFLGTLDRLLGWAATDFEPMSVGDFVRTGR